MECFICKLEIENEKYKMVAFDRPHINLYAHISCYQQNLENILEYATEYIKNKIFSAKK